MKPVVYPQSTTTVAVFAADRKNPQGATAIRALYWGNEDVARARVRVWAHEQGVGHLPVQVRESPMLTGPIHGPFMQVILPHASGAVASYLRSCEADVARLRSKAAFSRADQERLSSMVHAR